MLSLQQLAKYPFLPDAAEYIKNSGIQLKELLESKLYGRARETGRRRVMEAIVDCEIKEHGLLTTDANCLVELLSYPFARMLVSEINDSFLIKRYALAEAVRAEVRLQKEDFEFINYLSAQFDIDATNVGEEYKIYFADFLYFAANLTAVDWKFVNQSVEKGFVTLPKARYIRILQEAVREKIESELPIGVPAEFVKHLETYTVDLKKLTESRKKSYKVEDTSGKIVLEALPPCIKRLMGMASGGEHIPHHGRFALTAFLRAIGLTAPEILSVFAQSPDFDEAKSRYQIEHITGIASATTYTPPQCSTMRTYGVCYNPDEFCKSGLIKHPLRYYRLEKKKIEKTEKKDEEFVAKTCA